MDLGLIGKRDSEGAVMVVIGFMEGVVVRVGFVKDIAEGVEGAGDGMVVICCRDELIEGVIGKGLIECAV